MRGFSRYKSHDVAVTKRLLRFILAPPQKRSRQPLRMLSLQFSPHSHTISRAPLAAMLLISRVRV